MMVISVQHLSNSLHLYLTFFHLSLHLSHSLSLSHHCFHLVSHITLHPALPLSLNSIQFNTLNLHECYVSEIVKEYKYNLNLSLSPSLSLILSLALFHLSLLSVVQY